MANRSELSKMTLALRNDLIESDKEFAHEAEIKRQELKDLEEADNFSKLLSSKIKLNFSEDWKEHVELLPTIINDEGSYGVYLRDQRLWSHSFLRQSPGISRSEIILNLTN